MYLAYAFNHETEKSINERITYDIYIPKSV